MKEGIRVFVQKSGACIQPNTLLQSMLALDALMLCLHVRLDQISIRSRPRKCPSSVPNHLFVG